MFANDKEQFFNLFGVYFKINGVKLNNLIKSQIINST